MDSERDDERAREAEQAEALGLANQAARDGDVAEMIVQLNRAGFLDGVMRRLTYRWSDTLGWTGCEEVVEEAMEALYLAVRNGKIRQSVEGFIWATAKNKAFDEHERRVKLVGGEEEIAAPAGEDDSREEPSRDVLRREALTVARRLLPALGQDHLIQVMGMILDGVEEGVVVSNAEIADALGLTNDVVRKSRERGFSRLRDRAEKAGETLTLEHALGVEDADAEEDE